MEVKIIDFGFATFVEDIDKDGPRCGTVNFVAPEILASEEYDTKSDVFSLGVILYYLIRGLLPFNSEEDFIV